MLLAGAFSRTLIIGNDPVNVHRAYAPAADQIPEHFPVGKNPVAQIIGVFGEDIRPVNGCLMADHGAIAAHPSEVFGISPHLPGLAVEAAAVIERRPGALNDGSHVRKHPVVIKPVSGVHENQVIPGGFQNRLVHGIVNTRILLSHQTNPVVGGKLFHRAVGGKAVLDDNLEVIVGLAQGIRHRGDQVFPGVQAHCDNTEANHFSHSCR